MGRYLLLQIKRVLKLMPFFISVTVALSIGLSVIAVGAVNKLSNSEDNKRFMIGVAGDTDNDYLKWGMSAVQTFDETRFSMSFVEMAEDDAKKALEAGEISAYVVIPEDFVENAMVGIVDPIKYVTTSGYGGIVTMLKNEITELVTDMVVYSQKGTYAVWDAMYDNGFDGSDAMTKISIEYVTYILNRSNIYSVSELGINGLGMGEYFVCAIVVLLLVLTGLEFALLYIKKDNSLNSLMVSRGHSVYSQVTCEYIAHTLGLALILAVLFASVCVGKIFLPSSISQYITAKLLVPLALRLIVIVLMLGAFNIMLFSLCDNIISGTVIHFFTGICLCYVTGCMYPIYAFPKVIQKLAPYLPTGLAREFLSDSFMGQTSYIRLFALVLYAAAFLGVACFVKTYKIQKRRGYTV